VVEASPGTALEMIEAELLFELLVDLLARPSRLMAAASSTSFASAG